MRKAEFLCLAVPFAILLPAWGEERADLEALLEGVREIGAPGSPGTLAVWSEGAFPVISDDLGQPVVAAARWERGRVVGLSHSGYADPATLGVADTARLVANAIRWCAPGTDAPVVALLDPGAGAVLEGLGFRIRPLEGEGWHSRLSGIDVVLSSRNDLSDAEIEAFGGWVRKGGSCVLAQTGWGWKQLSGGRDMRENSLDRLLAPAGIGWTDAFARESGDRFLAKKGPPAMAHGLAALEALFAEEGAGGSKVGQADLALAARSAAEVVRLLDRAEKRILPRLRKALANREDRLVPRPDAPLGPDRPLDRFLVAYQVETTKGAPPREVEFLALQMYALVQEEFGWEAFKKVLAEYRGLPAQERPGSDDQKRDQWLVRLSRTVERDLGGYFQAWGVPTSEEARARIADLPDWMPQGFPPE